MAIDGIHGVIKTDPKKINEPIVKITRDSNAVITDTNIDGTSATKKDILSRLNKTIEA
jgi:hypothetical protein